MDNERGGNLEESTEKKVEMVWASGHVMRRGESNLLYKAAVSLCLYVSAPPPFFSTRPLDRNHIWHTYSGRYGTNSQLKKFDPPHPRGVPWGVFRGSQNKKSGKYHELGTQKTNKKNVLTPGGPMGVFKGSKNKKSGKCHEMPRNFFFKRSWVIRGWTEGGAGGREGTGREKGRQAGKERPERSRITSQ